MRRGGIMKLGIALLSLWLTLSSVAQEASVPFRLIEGWAIVLEGTLGGDRTKNC
jgi:hypothetical protein